jgi:hypothetical protein
LEEEVNYFYDTEFLEDGKTIKLISLGMVAEDGREFYGENIDAPWWEISEHRWLLDNVVPHLSEHAKELLPYAPGKRRTEPRQANDVVMTKAAIAGGVLDLVGTDPFPMLWAYYASYDHVSLAQLWGPMIHMPSRLPMWTADLMQKAAELGVRKSEFPPQEGDSHNALADARWNFELWRFLESRAQATR